MQNLLEDYLDAFRVGGCASGVIAGFFSGREVVLIQGFAAGFFSFGIAIAAYVGTAFFLDAYTSELLQQWSQTFGIVATLGSHFIVASFFLAPVEVLLVANCVGAFSYYFFSEEMYS